MLANITRQYEAGRDLIDYVQNQWRDPNNLPFVTISKYDYANDALGRRSSVVNSGEAFAADAYSRWGYNNRNELTTATRHLGDDPNDWLVNPAVGPEHFSYAYDPIGNRLTYDEGLPSTQTEYERNALNQYSRTERDSATPAAQNFSTMKTATWSGWTWPAI